MAFVAVLLAVPLVEDIQEAAVEEALIKELVHHRAGLRRVLGRCSLLRVSLCLRRIALPFAAIGSATGVLLRSPLSSGNILLNMLAVAFITEIDNMLATFLPPAAARRADPLMHGVPANPSWLQARVVAVLASGLLVAGVIYVESLISLLRALLDEISPGVFQPCGIVQMQLLATVFVGTLLGLILDMLGRTSVVELLDGLASLSIANAAMALAAFTSVDPVITLLPLLLYSSGFIVCILLATGLSCSSAAPR